MTEEQIKTAIEQEETWLGARRFPGMDDYSNRASFERGLRLGLGSPPIRPEEREQACRILIRAEQDQKHSKPVNREDVRTLLGLVEVWIERM